MITLTRDNAVNAVRKNLDEQGLNASAMFGESTDNTDMNTLIQKTIPEAINAIVMAAPVNALEGVSVTPSGVSISNGVVTFSCSERLLRLVAFKMSDSPIVVTDVMPEASSEGRKQLNPYVRGTYDRPVLVQVQGKAAPYTFRYYTVKDASATISRCEFCMLEEYDPSKTSYSVPVELYWPIIYRLTAMVLEIYGEAQQAQVFNSKINF